MSPYVVGERSFGEFAVRLYERLGSGGQRRKPKIPKVSNASLLCFFAIPTRRYTMT
jgi:hypothetical protein